MRYYGPVDFAECVGRELSVASGTWASPRQYIAHTADGRR